MSRGNSFFRETSLRPSPRVLKELGPTRGLPPANWGEGVHTYMPCMLVAGLALQSKDWRVKSIRVNSAFHPSMYVHEQGGTPRPYQGWNPGNCHNCSPQISVSPKGRHTAATKLLHDSIGTSQVAHYVCTRVCVYVGMYVYKWV